MQKKKAFFFSFPSASNFGETKVTKNGEQIINTNKDDDQSNILQSLTAKSENIMNALRAQSPIRLSWTHYSIILQESNKEARDWYEQETA